MMYDHGMKLSRWSIAALALSLSYCSTPAAPVIGSDAGPDAGPACGAFCGGDFDAPFDAGPPDAGLNGNGDSGPDASVIIDAGPEDAGTAIVDAGAEDAGTVIVDAGMPDAGYTDGGPASNEYDTLQEIATAFRAFRRDTDGWPLGHGAWSASNSLDSEILGLQFYFGDEALFSLPPTYAMLPQCDATHTGGAASPCWNGPYLPLDPSLGGTDALGLAPWTDAWGNACYFAYLRPNDGQGGGDAAAPNGLVYIWSAGPDGLDSFACSDSSCSFDESAFVQGHCSGTSIVDGGPAPCDDIIVTVSNSSL